VRTVAIVQARLTSTRLPRKAVADLGGRPLIERVLRRVLRAREVGYVVLAVPDDATAGELRGACAPDMTWVEIYADEGHDPDDVLGRYVRAARSANAEVIVRVCGDCPFVDPDVIDEVVQVRAAAGVDYAGNTRVRTYPRGLDVEAFTLAALERELAWVSHVREHVTPSFLRAPPRATCADVGCGGGGRPERRWCVDEASDLDFARALWAAARGAGDRDAPEALGWRELLRVSDAHEFHRLNEHIRQAF